MWLSGFSKMNKFLIGAGLILLMHTLPAHAEVSDQEFAHVKHMLEQALARIKELEEQHASETTVSPTDSVPQMAEAVKVPAEDPPITARVATNTDRLDNLAWAERIRLKGDFLYRYQVDEGKELFNDLNDPEADRSRNRQRIRAHLAVIADLPGNVEIGFGLATGGDDPVSAVQTLGGAGSSKAIQLDLAYFDWEFVDGASLAMGKLKNRFYRPGRNGLMWDSDWRPEGIDLRYDNDLFYLNSLGTWFEGDSNKKGNGLNYGVQAGLRPVWGRTLLNFGAGYWSIETEGLNCFDSPSNTGGNGAGRGCFGNTATDGQGGLVPGGTPAIYAMDYTPLELYASAEWEAGLPLMLFVDVAKNIGAKAVPGGPSQGEKLDTAFALGAAIGNSSQTGDWQFKLIYQDIEADSVLGLLTDSNFAGGGTDSKGFKLSGKYMFNSQTSVGLSYFLTERQDSNGVENGSPATSNPFDINTLQIDVLFKSK